MNPFQMSQGGYNRIAPFYKQYYGRDATDQELTGWGRNIDDNYARKIQTAMQGSQEAKDWATKNAPPAQQTQPSAPASTPAPAPAATGSPVSANGQIPPPTHTPGPSSAQGNLQPTTITPVDPTGQGQALLNAILGNPETMNPQVVSQLKEQQKEQALLMGEQGQARLGQAAASRGLVGSGQTNAQLGDMQHDVIGQILNSNRGVDVAAAQTNRQDQLNALQAMLGYSGANTSNQMAQFGINQAVAGNQLDWSRLLETARQFNGNLGLGYNQLNQNGQNALLQWLMGATQ